MIENQEIPVIQVGIKQHVRSVTAADHSIIPAQSESVIDVYVERREYDDFSCESEYIIEPTKHFQQEYPLQMASTLVDINQGCTCKVRVLNPFPTAISIKQNAVLGKAEPIKGISRALVQQENKEERENYCSVRRLQMMSNDDTTIIKDTVEQSRRVDETNSCYIPEHLTSLYEKSSMGLEKSEKEKLQQLLVKFQDSFSKNEWDLGLTHLTEHSINTGSAAPVKQPPRRVPLAFCG